MWGDIIVGILALIGVAIIIGVSKSEYPEKHNTLLKVGFVLAFIPLILKFISKMPKSFN